MYRATDDTIVAISTPVGEGAIGVVRLSGKEALHIGSRLFRPSSAAIAEYTPRRAYYGTFVDERGQSIDDGIFLYMESPRSFTGEDVVELQVHGSMVVLERLVEAAIGLGARPAEPGEFTRRAFLNGKIDLLQAEAIIDLIRAKTERAARSARGRLEGRLSGRIARLKESMLNLVAQLEAELDFEEDEVEGLTEGQLLENIAAIRADIEGLLEGYREGRALNEGIALAILGRPNVGKSTLLNLLLREERAIVTPHPGTTRDPVEATVSLKGIPLRLVDTAGLRHTEDPIESIGIERAIERAEQAELVLFVVDSSSPQHFDSDRAALKTIGRELKSGELIVVANKIDLVESTQLKERLEALGALFEGFRVVALSAKTEQGLEQLEEAVYGLLTSGVDREPEELIVSLRHKDALRKTLKRLTTAADHIGAGEPREIIAIELRAALDELSALTGETTTEEILDRIFSTFCIGK